MEIIGAAALIAVGIVVAAVLYGRIHGTGVAAGAGAAGARSVAPPKPTIAGAAVVEAEAHERTAAVAQREAGLARREAELARREADLELEREGVAGTRQELERSLERVSGMSASKAKQVLLKELEDQARHDAARLIRQIEEETKRDADRRVRNILSVVHAAARRRPRGRDHGVGRPAVHRRHEGADHRPRGPQHPRAGEPHRRRLHHRRHPERRGPVRLRRRPPRDRADDAREAARRTAGSTRPGSRRRTTRPSPSSRATSSSSARRRCSRPASRACDPELVKLLGRLKFRTSYGQNVLAHSVECAQLAAMMAEELGASPKTARRAALLHDIGKAVTHEIEGPHALVGGDLARRHGETEAVAHAMEAHHNEVEPQTVEAVIVQAADALSGRAPGRPRRVARAVRQAPARPRADRHPPRGRRQGLRDAGRPRDPRDGRAGRDRRRRAPRCCRTRSRARSRRSSSTRARSRSR